MFSAISNSLQQRYGSKILYVLAVLSVALGEYERPTHDGSARLFHELLERGVGRPRAYNIVDNRYALALDEINVVL